MIKYISDPGSRLGKCVSVVYTRLKLEFSPPGKFIISLPVSERIKLMESWQKLNEKNHGYESCISRTHYSVCVKREKGIT